MIRRSVKVQLAAFALITLFTVSLLSARYVGLWDRVLGGQYTVSADFAESGGIFVGSEVSYRGVQVGRVEKLRLSKDGVIVDARIRRGVQIPKDTVAVVENRSAVGEQYLDFQPRTEGGRYLADGDTIARKDTRTPIRVDNLLLHLDGTVSSVDRKDLKTVVDELGTAFADGGTDLQRLLDNGDALTRAATEALPQTVKLIEDGRIVLDTQRDTSGQIKTFATNFANLSETLKGSDSDLRLVLDRGAVASGELDGLIRDNQSSLAALLANLITVGQVTTARTAGIEQLLVTYPDVIAGGYTVVPGDGTAHFGLVLSQDPAVCKRGYEGTKRTDPNQTTKLPPVNTGARCALPRGSSSTVRGAQNAPGPSGSQSSRSAVPLAIAGQPVSPGTAASLGTAAPDVSVPLPPTGGGQDEPSWLWMMKEAAR
ncbi:phospholipid/cholesterol/gamma-HCH transport system substrate-binding protein [Pedococcus cremeus]|uniref:Phospholipid/cholesterol/gamma-HCH transport system substrate-binding protein n=1 Tax=Pedococcus cremeus TaxID=587636 RepID=A0A1H9SDL5_9MICO|nr:MlaD family protein [Pedococcus cremeus]SER82463.1 phospholipid/cholesterol/gamma-HCH transport system substrate-binding protein [Pedococcus cremeus]